MDELNKKEIVKHLFYILLIIGLVVLYRLLDITCPILYITGVPCPTCGCTRAIFSLLRGDIDGYMYYQPYALPLIIVIFFALHSRFCPKYVNVLLDVFIAVVLLGNTIQYIERLVLFFANK